MRGTATNPVDDSRRLPILPAFERFRSIIDGLWPRMAPSGTPSGCTRFACLGAQAGDGTTTIAACAAIGLAENLRTEVLLLEANLRAPSLAGKTGHLLAPGLRAVLDGQKGWREVVFGTDVPGLSVLTAGISGRASRRLDDEPIARLFADLEGTFRYVIVDGPPLPVVPDGRVLLRHADGALPVVRAGRTPRTAASSLLKALENAAVPLVCVVLNHSAVGRVEFVEFSGYRAQAPVRS